MRFRWSLSPEAVVSAPDFAEVDANPLFEARWNKLMVLVQIFVAFNIALGMLGLLGTGPLSSYSTHLDQPAVNVTYERVTRRTVQSSIVIEITKPLSTRNLLVILPNELLRIADVVSTSPRANSMFADRGGIIYQFDIGGSGEGEVRVEIKPRQASFINSVIKIADGSVPLRQLTLP